MTREAKADLVVAVVLTGFFASVAFHYWQGIYLGRIYPHDTFLYNPADRFTDFFDLVGWNRNRNPYLKWTATPQYPVLNLLSWLLSLFPRDASFWIFHAPVTAGLLWAARRAMGAPDRLRTYQRTFVVTLMTYPFLFTIDRGNLESLVCLVLLLWSWAYGTGRGRLAAFLLGLAISMKPFPVFLLAVPFSDRRHRDVLISIAWTALLTLASLATFRGGLSANLAVVLGGGNLATNTSLAAFAGASCHVQRGMSLFTVTRVALCAAGAMDAIDVAATLRAYNLAALAASVACGAYVVLVERVRWRKVAILAYAMLLFPHISADYKLLHVLVPLFLFVEEAGEARSDPWYALGFALLLVPKDYVLLPWVTSEASVADLGLGVLVNPLLMLAMMAGIVVAGLRGATRAGVAEAFAEQLRALRALGRSPAASPPATLG
jgi:hypothetical protein